MRARRTTPDHIGNRPGTNKSDNPKHPPKDEYTVESYNHRAITRGCKKAGVSHWHAHQLRHSCATELRKEFGLEIARIVLGHRSPDITNLYAEIDTDKALDVMSKIG